MAALSIDLKKPSQFCSAVVLNFFGEQLIFLKREVVDEKN